MPSRIPLLFGTATIGGAGHTAVRVSDTGSAQRLLDSYFDLGYKELDAARLYGDGTTEEFLGKVDLRGGTIDTKIYPAQPGAHSPAQLRATLDVSLKALRPHTIRILYLHAPDRSVPYVDTLRAIDELYREGKFEEFGLSNYPAWDVVDIVHLCRENGFVQPTVYQGMYNAISRTIEPELIPAIRKFGLRLVTYNPLAGGFFTGKASFDAQGLDPSDPFHPDNGWLGPVLRAKYLKDGQLEALKIVAEVAKKHNLTLPEIGHRWVQHHSQLQPGDGVVFGASSVEHVRANVAHAEKGPLPDAIVAALDLANRVVGLDAPFYAQ
ncbi:Aldo/keto reductase [Dentipellis sp. KUC8613]|nr:Aldo/keto reductase [Dentipellis sp. KUC8613]